MHKNIPSSNIGLIGLGLECDFVLVGKICVDGISCYETIWKKIKMKIKSEEERNRLLVELLYDYHFRVSQSSILEKYHCE